MNNNHVDALWGFDNTVAVLKLNNDWRFEKSPLLEQLLCEILPKIRVKSMVIDLNNVTFVDSTILGLLAQIGLAFRKQCHQTAYLVSSHPEINEILLSMAFDTIFKFSVKAPLPYPALSALEAQKMDVQTLEEAVLNSHKTLTSLSENNKKAFAELIQMLEKS